MKLIVGLGNPGEKYLKTRHNTGFMAVDSFVTKHLPVKESEKFWIFEKKFKAEIGRFGEDVILVKPQTFMNNSGMSVSLIKNFYKIAPEDIYIIHDDLDLVLGKIKVRLGGAAAGHHGVESIIKELGTDKFIRVRIGIGNEKSHSGEHKRVSFSAEKFVVEEFLSSEKSTVKHILKLTINVLDILLKDGIEVAQNQFN